MKLSIKEKAGIDDASRIYEGFHLTEGFIRNSAIDPDSISQELSEEGNRHFSFCDKCRNKKEDFLPFNEN